MKIIVCEMCGSKDLIKQESIYICQSCGTKYSTEEARKLMVEVEGTVNVVVDNTASVDNMLQLAKKSLEIGNYQEAEDYANRVIENKRDSYYAWFIKGVSIGKKTTLAKPTVQEGIKYMLSSIEYAPREELDSLKNSISKEAYSMLVKRVSDSCQAFGARHNADLHKQIISLIPRLHAIIESIKKSGCQLDEAKFNNATAKLIDDYALKYWYECMYNELNEYNQRREYFGVERLEEYRNENLKVMELLRYGFTLASDKALKLKYYEHMVNICTELLSGSNYANHSSNNEPFKSYTHALTSKEEKKKKAEEIMGLHREWNKLDSSHEVPKNAPYSGGCYIATCVYGSYDCPQVWTLRRYRDNTLGATWYGRAFIRAYYKISPTLVKWFGHTNWFKRLWRGRLDKMIEKLNSNGVEDTPYDDKIW